jgi:hypothetical protein
MALRLKELKDAHEGIFNESAENVRDARAMVKENRSPTTVNTASRAIGTHAQMIGATMAHGLYDAAQSVQ